MSDKEEANLEIQGSPLSIGTEEPPTSWKLFLPIYSHATSSRVDSSVTSLTRKSVIVYPKKRSSPGPPLGDKVCVALHKQDLWKTLSDVGNEMVVTRQGR